MKQTERYRMGLNTANIEKCINTLYAHDTKPNHFTPEKREAHRNPFQGTCISYVL